MVAKKKVRVVAETKTKQAAAGTEAKPKTIHVVKKGLKYRGNREAWYNLLLQMEGKTEQDFVDAATKKPPALTKAQTPEPPTGWFRFFERTGVLELK